MSTKWKNKYSPNLVQFSLESNSRHKSQCSNNFLNLLQTNDVTVNSRASRQSSSLIQKEEYIVKQKRQKMEILIIKFQQQKKCIDQLQQYIDQLEKDKKQKQQQIQQLVKDKQSLNQKVQSFQQFSKLIGAGNQKNIECMTVFIRQQTNIFEIQRKKWQKQKSQIQNQYENQKQLQQERAIDMKRLYQNKVQQIQSKSFVKQQQLQQRIRQIQIQNQKLIQQNRKIADKNKITNQFEKMINIRKQIIKSEQNRNKQNLTQKINLSTLKQQIIRLSEQLKKARKQNYKVKNLLQSKEFEIENIKKQIDKKDKQLIQMQQKYKAQSLNSYRQLQKVKRAQQQKEEHYIKMLNELQNIQIKNQCISSYSSFKGLKYDQQKVKYQRLQSLRKKQQRQIQKINKVFDKLNLQ